MSKRFNYARTPRRKMHTKGKRAVSQRQSHLANIHRYLRSDGDTKRPIPPKVCLGDRDGDGDGAGSNGQNTPHNPEEAE